MVKRIAIIGGGVSGIAAANIFQKNGYTVTIYEKNERIGGVWAVAYPQVRLQNSWQQYGLSNFPWTFKPDLHPTGEQILHYMEDAVKSLNLDVRTSHEVITLAQEPNGWQIQVKNPSGIETSSYDYVLLASGQYTEGKNILHFPDQDKFNGIIVTERDIKNLDIFKNKRVAVVGFGKSALDMATFAAEQKAEVHHIFREARWTIPPKILGIHYSIPLFARFGSVMMTSWAHPSGIERFLHRRLKFIVAGFWRMLALVFGLQILSTGFGKSKEARQRLNMVKPKHALLPDLRSAIALAPKKYYRYVVDGKIQPHHGNLAGFCETGIRLEDNTIIACDVAVLSVGSKTPQFPYMPSPYRELLEKEEDGIQLYRHLIHPRIPNMGFAGFNHGFMHIPTVEVGTIWLCALLDGHMQLPSIEEMEASIENIRQWKRNHIRYEPSRSMAVSTRYQQYLDILLKDLKLNPYRKGINVFGEMFMRYGSRDYRNILTEYQQKTTHPLSLDPLKLDT